MRVIETDDLGKQYSNGVRGLSDLSLYVERGEICGLLGPNGAGKSTTVRILNGTLAPTQGRAMILGTEDNSESVRRRTATLSESANLYEHLSIADNLRFYGALYGMERGDIESRIDELMKRVGLTGKKDLKYGSFSTGMKKRVQLARTILHRPELLFLDEPTSGLDPEGSVHVISLIETLARQEETTVLLCTHNLTLAERICDRYGLLDSGTLAAFGTKEELFSSVMKENRVRIVSQLGTEEHSIASTEEINGVIQDVIARGGYISDVATIRPSLEDVYFHYVGSKENESTQGETE